MDDLATRDNYQSGTLSSLALLVIDKFEAKEDKNHERKISVNPVVAKFATWYEKFRNSMEYREDEVILRAAIERILKRRLLLGGNGTTTAEPLVREVVWARYLPDNKVPESAIGKVEHVIDLYLRLRLEILRKKILAQNTLDDWIYDLMSSEIEAILNPNTASDTVSNFMYQVMRSHVQIVDDSEQTRDAQVYIAVRRSFSRDDLAFLRYHLFLLFFGKLKDNNVPAVADNFSKGYQEIEKQLRFIRKERINNYTKKRAAAFFILEELLNENKDKLSELFQDVKGLDDKVFGLCETKYKTIKSKVRRAVIRSVLFILLTKVIFAFTIEAAFELLVYGEIYWSSIAINIIMAPVIMIIFSLFIRTPGKENSSLILSMIKEVMYSEEPRLGHTLMVQKNKVNKKPILQFIFNILWLAAFLVSFGLIVFILTKLHFNPISQFVFIFFLAIVSFLIYRINLLANIYTAGEKQGFMTPVIDFLFMPIVRVGQRLTTGISQINILIFIFDFIIETPFKIIFGFTEQWFRFMHDKREDID